MKFPIEDSKKEGDFIIKASFTDIDRKKINQIDVIRKVPFTFKDSQVEETAILRFKDNHKKGEIYTIETIFAHMLIDKAYCLSGYATFPANEFSPFESSKYRIHPTLKTIWKDPVNDRHINDFMILFNNFHLFIKKNCIVEFEYSSLTHYAHQIYEAYKKENENKKVLRIPNRPQQFYDGLIDDEDIFKKVFIGGFYER